jgi:hypothetical protein
MITFKLDQLFMLMVPDLAVVAVGVFIVPSEPDFV